MSINVTVHGNPISINRGKMVSLDPDKEFALRRKIRLQQVRQQSKEIAEDVRNKVKNERKKQTSKNLKNAEKCLDNKKQEMLKSLNEQYQYNLERFGEAYRNAEEEVDPEVIMKQIKQHNKIRAEKLGKKANENQNKMKQKMEMESNEIIERKKNTRHIENIRSKLVSGLEKIKKTPPTKKKKRKIANASIIINGISEILSEDSANANDLKFDNLSVIEEISRESQKSENGSTIFEQPVSNKKSSSYNNKSLNEDKKNPDLIHLYSSFNYDTNSNDSVLYSEGDTSTEEPSRDQETLHDQTLFNKQKHLNDQVCCSENRECPSVQYDSVSKKVSSRQKIKHHPEKNSFSGSERNLNAQYDDTHSYDKKSSTRQQFSTDERNLNAQRGSNIPSDLNSHRDSNVEYDSSVDLNDPRFSHYQKPSTSRQLPKSRKLCAKKMKKRKHLSYDTPADLNVQRDLNLSRDLNVHCDSNVEYDSSVDYNDPRFSHYQKDSRQLPDQQFSNKKTLKSKHLSNDTLANESVPRESAQKVLLSHKKNKSKKKTADDKIKTKNVIRKTITTKQEQEKSPKKQNLTTFKDISQSNQNRKMNLFSKSKTSEKKTSELPYVSTVIVHPEHSESQPSSINFYDHFKHVDTRMNQPVLVQKISKDSIEVLPSDNEEGLHRDKISRQEFLESQTKARGQKAIQKNKIHQDYQQLMEELPVLKRQEQLTAMFKNKQNLHMSEKRLEDYEREKQNRMENAYEKMLPCTIPLITLKPIKKLQPSSDIKESFKTLDITENDSHILNVGQWEKSNNEHTNFKEDSNIPDSTIDSQVQMNPETDNEKVITDLLQRINKQRDLLLQEAANLPSLVNLKKVLSDQELLKLIFKCPPEIIQPKVLKEAGTSPFSTKTIPQKTKKDNKYLSDISKSSSKRMAVTSSSSDTSVEQKNNSKKKSKKLVKRSKLLIKEEATQTSPAVAGKTTETTKMKKEESTQTTPLNIQSERSGVHKHIVPEFKNLLSENSSNSNSDKVCEIIIRASDDKKVEITHRSTNTDNNMKFSKLDKPPSQKSESISNYIIKVKENEPKKMESKVMEISTGTSYQSLPNDVANQIKNKQTTEQHEPERTISNKELFNPQKKQTNIDQLIQVESNGSKEINPRLVKYIKKLLCMSRQSIDDLTLSTVSEVSTPHESVIQTENNQAKDKLQSVMQHFNLTPDDIQKYYISSSTLSTSDLSLENEIKEIMKPTTIIYSDDTSFTSQKEPSGTLTDNDLKLQTKIYSDLCACHPSNSNEIQSDIPPRPKSPGPNSRRPAPPGPKSQRPEPPGPKSQKTVSIRPISPGPCSQRPQSPEPSSRRPQSPGSSSRRPQSPGPSLRRPQSSGPSSRRPQSPEPQSRRSKSPVPSTSKGEEQAVIISHPPEQSTRKETSSRRLSTFIDDVDRSRPESRKQFSKTRDLEKFTSFPTSSKGAKNDSSKVISGINDNILNYEFSVPPQGFTKYMQETRSLSVDDDPQLISLSLGNEKEKVNKSLQSDKNIQQENVVSTSRGSRPKTAMSPRSNRQSPNEIIIQSESSGKQPDEVLKFVRESLGMTDEEFSELGIEDIFSQHFELTEYCQQRINKLVDIIDRLRSEKMSMRTSSPEDPASITITSYLDLPDNKKVDNVSENHASKEESSSSSSTISQETVDKYLLGVELNPVPPEKTKKRKEKEADVSQGKQFVSDSTETFVPILQGIPKYGQESTTVSPFLSQVLQELKSKPPPSILRANMRGFVDVIPHELSTIAEGDTLISSRNTSLQQPKTPIKTPMSLKKTEKGKLLHCHPTNLEDFVKTIPGEPENDKSKEIENITGNSSLSGNYVTITPEKSMLLNESSLQLSSPHQKSPKDKSNKTNKSFKTQNSPKTTTSTSTSNPTSNQDFVRNLCVKSSISGVHPLSDSTNTSPDELESLLRKFKLEWAISLVKKTEQALALSSSSSTSDIDSRLKSSDISVTDLYRQLYKKLLSSNGSYSEKSQRLSDLSSQFHDLNELSRIQNVTLQKQENKSDSRNKSQQQRTSTPVQISNSSGSFSKENLFKGDSEISSVRNSSDENMFLTIPNISLNTTNCSLNKSKKQ